MGALCWLLAALFAPTEACWSGAGRAPPGGAPNGTCCAVLLPTGHGPHGAGQVGAGRTPGREPALHVEEAGRSIAVLSYQAPFLCAALGAPHAAHRDAVLVTYFKLSYITQYRSPDVLGVRHSI